MPLDVEFQELVRRVRSGDDDAAATLIRLYEPEVRRIVRVRLAGSNLRRLVDSADICQSVLANFFLRAASGQFELESPAQLLKLLVTMACNKFNEQYRRQHAKRRGEGKRAGSDELLKYQAAPEGGPCTIVAMRELLQRARDELTPDELYLAEQRSLGRDWADLAAELGASADALRKRLARALDRVMQQLGLEEADNV